MLTGIGLQSLLTSLSEGEPSVSIRCNIAAKSLPDSIGSDALPDIVAAADSQVPWCGNGYYFSERPAFTLDPAFHQGRYYVQEASSMFHQHIVKSIAHLIADETSSAEPIPLSLLDACAAPGGKTTAAIDALPDGSIVVANEYVPARAAILRENAIKWGFPGIVVTRGDTRRFSKLRGRFDIVIADVPCSGEGMMRKDAEAVSQWSEGLIEECAARQWEIINNLWDTIRPGGYLIYSTCTFNRIENEEMVQRIIDQFGGTSVPIPVDGSWGITPAIGSDIDCYRFLPGNLRGEGLFVSVIRKDGIAHRAVPTLKGKTKKGKKDGSSKVDPKLIRSASDWIVDADRMEIYLSDERISAFPKAHLGLLMEVRECVDIIHEGVLLGNVKGKDIIPSQSLAMSRDINTASFPTHDIDRDEALRYLHGEALALPDSVVKGFVLLTYQNRPLGFVKNLGNRSNNLYPTPWRIKHL